MPIAEGDRPMQCDLAVSSELILQKRAENCLPIAPGFSSWGGVKCSQGGSEYDSNMLLKQDNGK